MGNREKANSPALGGQDSTIQAEVPSTETGSLLPLCSPVTVKVTQSCLTLCDPLEESVEFSRPEYWSG